MIAVKAIYRRGFTDYEGLSTYRAMPTRNVPINALDPFLFLNHHGPQIYLPHDTGLPFGPHPHKGFETVTFVLEGDLVHKDSTGYTSNIKAGGIQWMTAGKGIIHLETSADEFIETGGPVELLQLWVNPPANLKNAESGYVGLQRGDIPLIQLPDEKTDVPLVSGSWGNHKAPKQSLSDVNLSWMNFKKEGTTEVAVPAGQVILFYVIKGKVVVNGEEAVQHELVEFENEEGAIEVTAIEESIILFGHAQPTGEPIVAHGCFVMNTQEEIRQAFVDHQQGKLGEWKEY